MGTYLLEYKKIIDKFVKREISAKKFTRTFSKLFYDESLKPANDLEFDIIEELWGWLDLYEPKKYIRRGNSDYMNETQLRKKVKEFQKKINDLLLGKKLPRRKRDRINVIDVVLLKKVAKLYHKITKKKEKPREVKKTIFIQW